MRSVLADDLDFAGPIDRFDSADAYQQAIRGLSKMKTDIAVHVCLANGPAVSTCYDLHTRVAPSAARSTCRYSRQWEQVRLEPIAASRGRVKCFGAVVAVDDRLVGQ